MEKIKKIINSFYPSLINILLFCLMSVFINCSAIQDILSGLGGNNSNNNQGTVQELSQQEIIALCSTNDPGLSFKLLAEEKQIYTSDAGSSVKVTFCNSYAGFTDDLILDSPANIFIANNDSDPIGTTKDLGSFNTKSELVFAVEVQDTGYTYFTGPGSRNPDGLVHAEVFEIDSNLYFISFEDQYDGGDQDYNDMNFIVYINPD